MFRFRRLAIAAAGLAIALALSGAVMGLASPRAHTNYPGGPRRAVAPVAHTQNGPRRAQRVVAMPKHGSNRPATHQTTTGG
jgi:hypothetical protein